MIQYKPDQNRKTESKPKSSKIIRLIILFFIVIVAGVGVLALTQYRKYTAALEIDNSDSTKSVTFTISEGESIETITDRLIAEGLLSEDNKRYFDWYLKQSGLGSTIQAGQFRIPQNLNIKELTQTLQNAGVSDLWITIPEGLRKDEIAQRLAVEFAQYDNSVFNSDEFLALTEDLQYIESLALPFNTADLEGVLFPDRYLLPIEATSAYVISAMVSNFKIRVGSDITYDDLIIASMLEREGRSDNERAMISDIIRRRFEEGWFLGIDATLLYHYKDWTYGLTFDSLKEDHPYNTYTRQGLPPTPISNPGMSSINGSLNPIENEYYFYLHDSSGNIHYGITYDDHLSNQAKYLQ